ncbi:MAG: FAD-binding and (Fe-S)-binding domain-containing protein [candidate division Zixibacteria bacterium]|nr:FAD-binding and (Fe-S)-binding domain-containing protein [candidate division Zixibacteria bacterium]
MRDKSGQVKVPRSGKGNAAVSREAYASDASLYRVLPRQVVFPANESELTAAVAAALAAGMTVTPRGGGTGLSGGALGRGVVVDCSRLTSISRINLETRTVTCQPGIIHRDINLAMKSHGLFFPPDPSSGDSCQIGGMLANNSSGSKSVKYGLTSDYVEELTVIDKDGRLLDIKKWSLQSDDWQAFGAAHPEYPEILRLLQENREIIRQRWPKVKKNSAGYNLLQVVTDLDRGWFNLPALYVGSEGTLGVFASATLRLLPLPAGSRSFRLFFGSLEEAGDAVAPLLETGPSSLEIVDGSTLDLIGRAKFSIPAQPEAMLLLEYDDDLDGRERALDAIAPRLILAATLERAADASQQQALWAARKAITPTLYRHHPVKRPVAFIEDASLPAPRLPEFIAWVRRRLEREGLTFGLFGHIGDGNLHIRPLLDLNKADDFALMETLYREVYDKILALGGSSTAEHADGRLRAPVVHRLYGDEIYGLFQRIKTLLDPRGLFNPDVILSGKPFTENIDLKKLELTCAACGKCNGYCPAFEIFRREDMSPRGWLRMMKIGGPRAEDIEPFYRYCLNCKSCTTVCPAGVDIAEEILAFKAAHPQTTAGAVISLFDRKALFSGALALGAVARPLTAGKLGRQAAALAGRLPFGWNSDVVLPQPARKNLRKRHPDLCRRDGTVAFFHGCADNYFVSAAGDALIRVFRHYGFEPVMPPQECCGLPMEVYGHRDNLIGKAMANLDALEPYEAVVFTCASCLHRLADYDRLFEPASIYHRKAIALKERVYDACQFLNRHNIELPKNGGRVRLTYHHPCHLRAAGLEREPLKLLSRIDGIKIMHPELAGRCCGQAGSFGYIHFREGRAMFAGKKEEYRKLGADVIVSSCPSCISKIKAEMGDGVRVCHPMEIVADLIAGGSIDGARGQ